MHAMENNKENDHALIDHTRFDAYFEIGMKREVGKEGLKQE